MDVKVSEMKEYDVNANVEWRRSDYTTKGFLNEFAGSVAEEVKKVKIHHDLETRPYSRKMSEESWPVAKRLTIVVDFGKAVIQPHNDFEGDFCAKILEAIEENVNGLFENSEEGAEGEE